MKAYRCGIVLLNLLFVIAFGISAEAVDKLAGDNGVTSVSSNDADIDLEVAEQFPSMDFTSPDEAADNKEISAKISAPFPNYSQKIRTYWQKMYSAGGVSESPLVRPDKQSNSYDNLASQNDSFVIVASESNALQDVHGIGAGDLSSYENAHASSPIDNSSEMVEAAVPSRQFAGAEKTSTSNSKPQPLKGRPHSRRKGSAKKLDGDLPVAVVPVETPVASLEVREPKMQPLLDQQSTVLNANQNLDNLSDKGVFSEALTKMIARREAREAEAARLNIILPSHGGSLDKLPQSLQRLMSFLAKLTEDKSVAGTEGFHDQPKQAAQ